MDIEVFTKERLKFAHFFYTQGVTPFKEIISLIENEKSPYQPIYDESGEPQYIYEWMQAQDGIESIGLASLSMLSSALQLYMNAWIDRVEARKSEPFNRKGNKGWFHALKKVMQDCGVDFSSCPVNLDILEQMVLARNRTQHSEDITSNSVVHLKRELERFESPVFVKETDRNMNNSWFGLPKVYVDETIFNDVINQVEQFCAWLETEYQRIAS
ncbi:hypothetical protein [Aliivibrio wodanis]|uniref:hypothetical protein n=1 Tax=Aliivibrio wodanis TaxID=80852 RepID=UPI00406D3B06